MTGTLFKENKNHPVIKNRACPEKDYKESSVKNTWTDCRLIVLTLLLWFASSPIVSHAELPAVERKNNIVAQALHQLLRYRIEYSNNNIRKLLRSLGPVQLRILEKLNRADLKHLPRLRALVFPNHWEPDELRYSPFSKHDSWAESYPKALIINLTIQAFAAYEVGQLVRWGPVSSGRRSNSTPPGLFHLNWKSKGRYSTVNPRWYMPWYFNFSNKRGLALHAYNLPGYPASHACVRLLRDDAIWLYFWGEEATISNQNSAIVAKGTPVLITGKYDYHALPPWLNLTVRIQEKTNNR